MKKWFWKLLARLLSAGVRLIRRRPGELSPDAWRAVRFSYSHYAEDLIVLHLFREKLGRGEAGVYVDIGCFDPFLFSNTLLLHQHGWRGVNVDPNPECVRRFAAARPADRSVCAAVADEHRPMTYLEYPTGGTNRLVDPAETERTNVSGEAPTRVTPITTVTLTDLLAEHLGPGDGIDFLNVDCEGEDLAVFRGLDWGRWVPRVVAVEAYDDAARAAVKSYLGERGYTPVAQAVLTMIFVHTGSHRSDLRVFA